MPTTPSSSKKSAESKDAGVGETPDAPPATDTLEEAVEVGYLGVTYDATDYTFAAQAPNAAPQSEEASSSMALPAVPAATTTYAAAIAAGWFGARTDPFPDILYTGPLTGTPPQLTSCLPNTGAPAGGTAITLAGVGLTGVTLVTVGQAPATSVVVVSDTQVTAVTPAGKGRCTVGVANPGGKSTRQSAYIYA